MRKTGPPKKPKQPKLKSSIAVWQKYKEKIVIWKKKREEWKKKKEAKKAPGKAKQAIRDQITKEVNKILGKVA